MNQEHANEKPSRWWILYHCWAGFCAKVYVDVSDLPALIVGPPSSATPGSAFIYATFSAVIMVGPVVLGYLLSKSLVKVIDQSKLPKKGKITLKSILPIIYFLSVLLFSYITALTRSESAEIRKPSTPVARESSVESVIAFTVSQSSEGVMEEDLDQTWLEVFEKWLVDTWLKKAKSDFLEMGYSDKDFTPTIDSNSVYVHAGGKKLAVIRIDMEDSLQLVAILGIVGPEMHRVTCVRESNRDIPIWSGECGTKVRDAFGVSLQPQTGRP